MKNNDIKFKGGCDFFISIPYIVLFVIVIWIMKMNILSANFNIVVLLTGTAILWKIFNGIKYVGYLVIKERELTYYSVFRPFGKTLYFDDFIGKTFMQFQNKYGEYSVLYLIDKQKRTAFKISAYFVNENKKFKKIVGAIPLRAIGFKPTIGQYLKLMWLGSITAVEKEGNKNVKKIMNSIAITFALLVAVGLLSLIVFFVFAFFAIS